MLRFDLFRVSLSRKADARIGSEIAHPNGQNGSYSCALYAPELVVNLQRLPTVRSALVIAVADRRTTPQKEKDSP